MPCCTFRMFVRRQKQRCQCQKGKMNSNPWRNIIQVYVPFVTSRKIFFYCKFQHTQKWGSLILPRNVKVRCSSNQKLTISIFKISLANWCGLLFLFFTAVPITCPHTAQHEPAQREITQELLPQTFGLCRCVYRLQL